MISYLLEPYEILCDFTCFLAPARAGSKAAPILFKCTPVRIKCSCCSSPLSVCPLWLRNQVAVVYSTSHTWPAPPSPSSPASETSPSLSSCAGTSCAGASCVMLGASWGWSMTVRLRRGGIPLHKLTLEKVGVRRVGRQLQDLENDVGVHLTKTCCAGIVGPADVRGNPNQARKVGDQVPGNLWHRGQSTNSRVHGTGQVRHVVTVAVKLLHNPPRT